MITCNYIMFQGGSTCIIHTYIFNLNMIFGIINNKRLLQYHTCLKNQTVKKKKFFILNSSYTLNPLFRALNNTMLPRRLKEMLVEKLL